MQTLRQNRLFQLGAVITLFWLVVAAAAPILAPDDPLRTEALRAEQPPSMKNPLGTDKYGRDILARLLFGTRYDLLIAVLSVGLAVAAGIILGSIAGLGPGYLDQILMRLSDMILAFPSFVLALVLVAVLGPNLFSVILALAVRYTPMNACLVRAEILAERSKDYALAARAMGSGVCRLALRHLIPNILPSLLTQATMHMAWAILTSAGLSFIGAGVQPPTPEWGVMVSEGSPYIVSGHWWMSFFPGAAIVAMTAGFILMGEALGGIQETSNL
ncbi:MAG: ABC transporter permease [Deltaproteobacteria bacterium]|nr:ABC transporter permease [Deltaproteobacteria bacterium]